MLNPIRTHSKKGLTAEDLIVVRHYFMKVYGWISLEEFKKVSLVELFDLYPLVMKEVNNEENLRLCSLKFYGVKNPK